MFVDWLNNFSFLSMCYLLEYYLLCFSRLFWFLMYFFPLFSLPVHKMGLDLLSVCHSLYVCECFRVLVVTSMTICESISYFCVLFFFLDYVHLVRNSTILDSFVFCLSCYLKSILFFFGLT